MEAYIQRYSNVLLGQSICEECVKALYPGLNLIVEVNIHINNDFNRP